MSAYFPPSPYFSNIDYNNTFFTSGLSNYLTLNYANSHYLYSYGIATSTASITQFNGSVGIGAAANGINGNLSITSLNVSSNAGIGTAINSSYTLNTNTLNAVTSISINGQLLNTLFQPVINTYIVSGGSGGSMNYSSGTLTLTLPLSYSSMSINSLTTATSFIYQGTELATTLLNYTTTAQMNTAISTALVPYSTTTQMNTAISKALVPYSTTSQMNTAISTALVPYSTTTQMNTAISTALVPYSTTTQMNTAISSAVSSYLPLSGGTMTGTLSLTTSTTDNQIVISNSSSAHYSTIRFSNNISSLGYIGIGGTNVTGNFANNFFIQSPNSIVFNTNGNATASTPNLLITSSGNVGINTASASSTLTVNGNTTTSNLNVYGVATFQTNNWITSSDTKLRIYFANNDATLFQSPNGYSFRDESGNSALYINSNLNVGIGITNPGSNLEVNGSIVAHSGFSYFGGTGGTIASATGLRIGPSDIFAGTGQGGNITIWSSVLTTGTISFSYFGGNTVLTINNSLVTITQPTTLNSTLNVTGATLLGTLNTTGNVAIGITSPAPGGDTLYVYGTARISGNVGIGTTPSSPLTIAGDITTSRFFTTSTNNIVSNTITLAPTSTTGGPYGNGYWLINIGQYTALSGFTYLFLNLSQPLVPIFWQGRVVISSGGSMNTYADVGYNVQLAYYTSGGTFIQISSPSGASLSLYYKVIG